MSNETLQHSPISNISNEQVNNPVKLVTELLADQNYKYSQENSHRPTGKLISRIEVLMALEAVIKILEPHEAESIIKTAKNMGSDKYWQQVRRDIQYRRDKNDS